MSFFICLPINAPIPTGAQIQAANLTNFYIPAIYIKQKKVKKPYF